MHIKYDHHHCVKCKLLIIILIALEWQPTAAILYKTNGTAENESTFLWISETNNFLEDRKQNEYVKCKVFSIDEATSNDADVIEVSPHHFRNLIRKYQCFDQYPDDQAFTDDDGFVGVFHAFARHPFIYPGTKWCGVSNRARHIDDLGPLHVAEDRCCREHDMCPVYLQPGQCALRQQSSDDNGYLNLDDEREELCNDTEISMSHCECDDRFQRCLRALNTPTANNIGYLYFKVIGIECFVRSVLNGKYYKQLLKFAANTGAKTLLLHVFADEIVDVTMAFAMRLWKRIERWVIAKLKTKQ